MEALPREDRRRQRRAHRRLHLTINDRRVDGSTGVVERAHTKGLRVHTWTFRNDASGYGFADPKAEMQYYMRLGVDGVFTDFPATGR